MNRRPCHRCHLIESLESRQLLSTVTVSNATAAESAGTMTFHVSLDTPADHDVTLKYVTTPAGRSATPHKDYLPSHGTITLAAGQTAADISVTLKDDSAHESAETFRLRLKATGAKLANAIATGTITDDDAAPDVTIEDVTTKEGNGGRHVVTLTATLAKAADAPVTFMYATSDDTPYYLAATAGADYDAAKGSLTFLPGQTKKTIRIPIVGDRLEESDETFRVTLTQAGDEVAAASVTIQDDDTASKKDAPVLSVSDTSALEGDDGETVAGFTVTLSRPADKDVTFRYAYPGPTAGAAKSLLALTPGYVPASGTFTIPARQTSATIFIKIHGDTTYEANQAFEVRLSGVKNARPINGRNAVSASFEIVDDEPLLFADTGGNYVAGISGLALPSDFLISYYNTGALNVPVLLSQTALIAPSTSTATLTRFPESTLTAVSSNVYTFNPSAAATINNSGSLQISNGISQSVLVGTLVTSGIGNTGASTATLVGTLTASGSYAVRGTHSYTSTAITVTGSNLAVADPAGGTLTLNQSGAGIVLTPTFNSHVIVSASTTLDAIPTFGPSGQMAVILGASLTFTNVSADAVRAAILSAFNSGTWTGPGLTYSAASSDPDHRTALGYASQPDGSVLVKPALYGDANLDGVVDDADRALVQESLSNPSAAPSWSAGDFNYDGQINADDLTLLDRNLGRSL